MMDFTFEQRGWELVLDKLHRNTTLSAARFLTLMEQESEEDFEDALALLNDRDVLLDVSDLPPVSGGGEMAQRLAWEVKLVAENALPDSLEEHDPLRLYLEEVAAIPVCGDPELLAGDENAREQLMNLELSRVIAQAYRHTGHGVLLMDLIQEGSLGLWQAILTYHGGGFEGYCDRCICRAMAQAIVMQARENGVGQKLSRALEDYRSVDERLLSELGRNPTLEEIADGLHMTLEETEVVAQMLDTARTVSRAKQAVQSQEETAEEELAVEDTAYFQMRQRIADLLSSLSESDAQLVTLRYGLEGGLPLSAEETARKLGITPAEVNAREAAALAKLRKK